MDIDTQDIGPTGAGQHQEALTEQDPVQPEYITRSDAERLITEANEDTFRRSQSLFDKGNQRTREEIEKLEKYFDSVKTYGSEIPENIKVQMRQDVLAGKHNPLEASPPDGQPSSSNPAQGLPDGSAQMAQQPDPNMVAYVDYFTGQAEKIMKEQGVLIEDNDPEVKMIAVSGTPDEYLESVKKAATAKAARLTREGKPEARVQGLGGQKGPSNPYAGNEGKGIDMLSNYFDKK